MSQSIIAKLNRKTGRMRDIDRYRYRSVMLRMRMRMRMRSECVELSSDGNDEECWW